MCGFLGRWPYFLAKDAIFLGRWPSAFWGNAVFLGRWPTFWKFDNSIARGVVGESSGPVFRNGLGRGIGISLHIGAAAPTFCAKFGTQKLKVQIGRGDMGFENF